MHADLIGDSNLPVRVSVSLHVNPVMNWSLVQVYSAESLIVQTGSSPCGRMQDLPHAEMSLHLHLPVYFFFVASGTKSGPCIRQRRKNKGHDSNPYTNNMILHVQAKGVREICEIKHLFLLSTLQIISFLYPKERKSSRSTDVKQAVRSSGDGRRRGWGASDGGRRRPAGRRDSSNSSCSSMWPATTRGVT